MKETIKTQILDAIAADQDDILKFTKEIVSIATENPPGAFYKPCVDAIKNKLSEIGLDYEIVEIPNQDSNLDNNKFPRYCILSFYGEGEKTLYFHGHYDVVPATCEEQFRPYVQSGNLFGRGTSDMKSGLAAMIYAIKAIKASTIELDGKIGLAIVPDEETGGLLGSKYLTDINVLGKNGIGMLLAEPTSGVIWNANRGAISLRITVKGKPIHVGLQYRGVNAFENMLVVANALLEQKKVVESRTTDYNIHPDPARRSILMIGGRCEGGSNTLEAHKKDGIDLEIEILQEEESAGILEDNPIAQSLVKNIEAITGRRPEFEMCPGLLEIRFYAKKGIPAFAFGPGLLSVSHGPNEYVKVKDIYKCTSIYALTALDVLSD